MNENDAIVERITTLFTLFGDPKTDVSPNGDVVIVQKLLSLLSANSLTSLKIEFDHGSSLLFIMFEVNGKLHHAKIPIKSAQAKLRTVLAAFYFKYMNSSDSDRAHHMVIKAT